MFKIFVYGTLKRGLPNHKFLIDPANGIAEFLFSATTKQKYPLVVGTDYHIPFLLNKEGTGHRIQGEVYNVDSKIKEILDEKENVGVLYDIIDVTVEKETGEEVGCLMYALNDYHDHMLEKPMTDNYVDAGGVYVPKFNRSMNKMDYVRQVKKMK